MFERLIVFWHVHQSHSDPRCLASAKIGAQLQRPDTFGENVPFIMKNWTEKHQFGWWKTSNCKVTAIFLRFRTSWKNQTNSLVASSVLCHVGEFSMVESVTSVVQTQKTQLNTSHPSLSPWARNLLGARWDPQATASPPWAPAHLSLLGSWFDRVKIYVWTIYPPGPPYR